MGIQDLVCFSNIAKQNIFEKSRCSISGFFIWTDAVVDTGGRQGSIKPDFQPSYLQEAIWQKRMKK